MKKTLIKIFTLAIASVMLICALASCGKMVSFGSYESKLEVAGQSLTVTYTFNLNKVEAESKITFLGSVNKEVAQGTYEITENSDGTMEITFDFEEETDSFKDKTFTYKEGEGFVEIGGVTYTKVEK